MGYWGIPSRQALAAPPFAKRHEHGAEGRVRMAPHGGHERLVGDNDPGAHGDGKGDIERVIGRMADSQADLEGHVIQGKVTGGR